MRRLDAGGSRAGIARAYRQGAPPVATAYAHDEASGHNPHRGSLALHSVRSLKARGVKSRRC